MAGFQGAQRCGNAGIFQIGEKVAQRPRHVLVEFFDAHRRAADRGIGDLAQRVQLEKQIRGIKRKIFKPLLALVHARLMNGVGMVENC